MKRHAKMRNRTERMLRGLYIVRVPHLIDHDIYGHNSPMVQDKIEAMVGFAHETKRHWQVLCMLNCNGGKYRVWSEVTTSEPILASDEGIVPLLTAALDDAEESVGINHDREVAMIIRPWFSQTPSIEPALLRAAKYLGISKEEAMEVAA